MRADDQRVGLACEAFFFGYPLVCAVRQIIRIAHDGLGPIEPAGFNAFAHETDPPGPHSHFLHVSPDVLVSLAQVDLSPGPLLLHVPPTPGRYLVLELYDVWLNVFAYLGTRVTGDDGGDILLLPPGTADAPSTADASAHDRVVEAPSRVVSIIARFGYGGPADLPAVRALQDTLTLHPPDPGARRPEGPPDGSKRVCDDLRFWEELRTWMHAFPPPAAERDYARRFEALGLLTDPSPYIDPDPRLAWSLRSGLRTGRDELERLAAAGRRTHQGWAGTLHEADYNLDRFGPGVLDDRHWEIPDRAQARIARAMAARRPLGIVHAYEATSACCSVDADGRHLTGAHSYLLRLPPPAVDAFWTVTMYDEPESYLVDNPLHRYAIDSRDDLVHAADGTVPILIQSDAPATETATDAGAAMPVNWLPAATGDFRLTLRMYLPGKEVLSGTYAPPPIHRLA
ncbi:DUF1254 domain-containing protein [Frankia sp. Mgl5]|uniref:DUF1254 domain-containing protein n=1 Tax=Frankia sp. Mgl5 TaxID=2933793 RepID=UPI00200FC201|nr:DUF1254 domain-containing protein [Frankia sp. Mgl5]MCK9930244.1 DUF1254 domain-containing protein [Frankia sp. Mgl5]